MAKWNSNAVWQLSSHVGALDINGLWLFIFHRDRSTPLGTSNKASLLDSKAKVTGENTLQSQMLSDIKDRLEHLKSTTFISCWAIVL